MHIALVLTVLGDDRPGLIETLSAVLEQHGANWLESRMVDLAGKFAGVLKVSVPATSSDALSAALIDLSAQGLQIQVQIVDATGSTPESTETLQLEVLGPDAPGIINNITSQLAALRINVDELCSEQRQAAMSGDKLFFAEMTLELPEGVTQDDVQDALEETPDQLMVSLQKEM